MNEDNLPHDHVFTRRMKQVFVLFAIIAGFFVFAEHRAHVIPYLPWLLLAACPLMHVFMRHGHGGHHHHGDASDPGSSGQGDASPSEPGDTNPPGSPQPPPHRERS